MTRSINDNLNPEPALKSSKVISYSLSAAPFFNFSFNKASFNSISVGANLEVFN